MHEASGAPCLWLPRECHHWMPPLGMLELQVLFAWMQLLSKLCSLVLLPLLLVSRGVLDTEEAAGSRGVSSSQCRMNGLFGAV